MRYPYRRRVLAYNFLITGYSTITNVDVSRVVIDQMIDRYKDKPTLQWQQMNVTALDFPDETFDVVIANPPFSVEDFKLTLENGNEDFTLFKENGSDDIECLFMEQTAQLLNEDGVVP